MFVARENRTNTDLVTGRADGKRLAEAWVAKV
jgi:hypothetical protein